MKLGMIGLGRMGANMARRLIEGGHSIVGFDPSAQARDDLGKDGAQTADSLKALVESLPVPRSAIRITKTPYGARRLCRTTISTTWTAVQAEASGGLPKASV